MNNNNITQKDEAAKRQDKIALDSELKAAEAHREVARSHEKQAEEQVNKSKS